jgi:hypothetical protein
VSFVVEISWIDRLPGRAGAPEIAKSAEIAMVGVLLLNFASLANWQDQAKAYRHCVALPARGVIAPDPGHCMARNTWCRSFSGGNRARFHSERDVNGSSTCR